MAKVKITVLENGPCLIAGTATFMDGDGNTVTTPGKAIALCRCGASSKKPFCDGGHTKAGFKAPATALDHDTGA